MALVLAAVQQTSPAILQDNRLLTFFFTRPLPRAPEYLATVIRYLGLHVNFVYRDPLHLLLVGIRDTLLRVTPTPIGKCTPEHNTSTSLVIPDLNLLVTNDWSTALTIPALPDHPIPHWLPEDRALVRPPEVAPSGTLREDGLLLAGEELELFFSNARAFLDVLLEGGLGMERLEYLKPGEQGHYFAPLLQLFQYGPTARVRRFALDYLFQLIPLGLDLYHDLLFETVHALLRQGSPKTLDDALESPEGFQVNFDKVTDFLTAWLRAGYDMNYQYAGTLIFAEAYGVPAQESLDAVVLTTVQYQDCSILALAAIYNRPDVLSWLLQFCAPAPLNVTEEEELFPRNLDVSLTVTEVDDDTLAGEDKYVTLPLTLRGSGTPSCSTGTCENTAAEETELEEWNVYQLAARHRSAEAENLLTEYTERYGRLWHTFNPLAQDISLVTYEAKGN